MHNQKTAGTTILRLAYIGQHYGVSEVRHYDDFLKLEPDAMAEADFLSGHFGYNYARAFMGDRYSFTFLREPIDRLISLYNFCTARDENEFEIYRIAKNNSFHDFLLLALRHRGEPEWDWLVEAVWNHQVWQFAAGWGKVDPAERHIRMVDFEAHALFDLAVSHMEEFDFVGLTETFDEDARHVCRELGMTAPESFPIHNESRNTIRREEIPAETMRLLLELTELDRAFYAHAVARRGRRQDIRNKG